jgi:polyisoprenoid-binding protein YceI
MRAYFAIAAGVISALGAPGAALAGEDYVIDPAHSVVQFSVNRFGFASILGQVRDFEGTVSLDEGAPEKSAVAVVLKTASLESGDPTRDEHLKGARWFDAATYPAIEFRSTGVAAVDGNVADVAGVLKLHGVEAPVTLRVTLNKLGEDPATRTKAAGFSATARVKRSDFGMTTAAALIGDDVDIRIEALAHLKE